MQHCWDNTVRENLKFTNKHLSHCHSVRLKSHHELAWDRRRILAVRPRIECISPGTVTEQMTQFIAM